MFLIRAAFWFSVVVLLIPGDPNSGTDAPRVGAIDALVAAQGAVSDLAGMCERQPDVCSSGGAALAAFGAKARYGVGLLYNAVDGKLAMPTLPGVAKDGTLTPADMAPQWHAPKAHDRNA
ncbi:hypothetical protein K32_13960 [Kaistia sp. 32K]|uniref:DUF5330 domain-containing protein n=1 Tax=Kaistia sp. 32K TaxID=2795690 RepID=UPI001915E7D3|nr:DUF5330 domain-containing protein [Kaistia sp. 32K]BCP52779.1 hypothetical protein K32_13960 [Kaistia sp. 32K]